MGSSKQRVGKRTHKYFIRVKWVSGVCCNLALLSPRLCFGRAGEHSCLPAQPGCDAPGLLKSISGKRFLLRLHLRCVFITFAVHCVSGGGPK